MDDTLIIGGSHSLSLHPLRKFYKNIKTIPIFGCTLYSTYTKANMIMEKIKDKKFKRVIFIFGYTDINGVLLYLKYNELSFIKTLNNSVNNFIKFIKIFKKQYNNIDIFVCNHIISPYYNNKNIQKYIAYRSLINLYIKQDHEENIRKESLFNKIKYEDYKHNKLFKYYYKKYNINSTIINNMIKNKNKNIIYFEKKFKLSCKNNNLIYINVNYYLKKIIKTNCLCLQGDIEKLPYEYDHHYIYEIMTICFLLCMRKYIKINYNIIDKLYIDYRTFLTNIKLKKKRICKQFKHK